MAWLRSHGEDDAVVHVEIAGVASSLMNTKHFAELDAFVSALVDRYRTHGPPTLLYVTLAMLGYSALFQGKADTAEQLFDKSASIDVPDRTSSVNQPAQARAALRRGDPSQAFPILGSDIEELLETDYTDLARNTPIEFINMMTAIDRLAEAERIRGYLVSTGDFRNLAARGLVNDAANRIAINAERKTLTGSRLPDANSMPGKHSSTCATHSRNLPTTGTPLDRLRPRPRSSRAYLKQVRSVKQRRPASHMGLIREGIGAGSFERQCLASRVFRSVPTGLAPG